VLRLRKGSRDQEHEEFFQNLSMFITSFCKVHLNVLEANAELHPHLLEALGILVQLSRIDDMEMFKICLEYWQWLGSDLYATMSSQAQASPLDHPLVLQQHNGGIASQRRLLYDPPPEISPVSTLARARVKTRFSP
jgi:exportin-1